MEGSRSLISFFIDFGRHWSLEKSSIGGFLWSAFYWGVLVVCQGYICTPPKSEWVYMHEWGVNIKLITPGLTQVLYGLVLRKYFPRWHYEFTKFMKTSTTPSIITSHTNPIFRKSA